MKSFFSILSLLSACYAQSVDFSSGVGGTNPPITFPFVTGYNALSGKYQHVVILSIDGFHAVDLAAYVALKPGSNMALLLQNAVLYSNVMCSQPSDSFPGTIALYTGATPRTTASNCTGTPGFEVLNDETIDINSAALDGGGAFNLTHLSYRKTGWGSCAYNLPHDFLRTKTIFEVVRENGGFTKLTEKHPAYEILNGPSGTGIYEGYFPEINAVETFINETAPYDELHWQAIYNWTAGNFQNGTKDPNGVAQLYAGNFQLFQVAQKQFGYLAGSTSAKPILTDGVIGVLDVIDTNLGILVEDMKTAGTYTSTLLIVGSKHGQAPINPALLRKIDPQTLQNATSIEFAQVTSDDIALIWLVNPTIENVLQAKSDLLAAATKAGILNILAGPEVYQHGFGDPRLDPRVPDLIVQVVEGVIYAGPGFKLMEHGGINPDDLTVGLFVHNPGITAQTITERVETRQIAVTALEALGAPVSQLDGAQEDGTVGLPGLGF